MNGSFTCMVIVVFYTAKKIKHVVVKGACPKHNSNIRGYSTDIQDDAVLLCMFVIKNKLSLYILWDRHLLEMGGKYEKGLPKRIGRRYL